MENIQLCPAVSVIIPMFNAEKYVAECLDSLLNQTFQNFEVIVVDDCSTDNSVAIVKSYVEKFAGCLKIYHMEKNSGSAPAPRNKGSIISRGEYVFFMDVDDLITPTALEELYTLAKNFDADVVYCERYFMSEGFGQEFIDNIHLADSRIQQPPFVDKPTFESDNLSERIKNILKGKFWVTPWLRLVSREMLAENMVTFPEIIGSDDVIWSFEVLCCAKKFLRVPNLCYVRRMYDDSFTRKNKPANKHIHQWMDQTIRGLKFTNDFMNKFEFFQKNLDYRYAILDLFSGISFNSIFFVCANLTQEEVYEIFLKEFSKDLGENAVLVAYLCSHINYLQKISYTNQQRFNEFASQAQQRIADLEKINREDKAYISESENYINELNRKDV